MAVANLQPRVVRLGDGVVKEFSFTFPITATSEVQVTLYKANGTVVALTSAQFTVSTSPTQKVVLTGAAPTVGDKVVITRATVVSQSVELTTVNGYDPRVVMGVWDKLTRIAQELTDKSRRAVMLPATYDGTPAQMEALTTAVMVVHSIASQVVTVSGVSTHIPTVSANAAHVAAVGAAIADVVAVSTKLSDVSALVPRLADIQTLAPRAADLATLGPVATAIATVAGIKEDILTVNSFEEEIRNVSAAAEAIVLATGSVTDRKRFAFTATAEQETFLMPQRAAVAENVDVYVNGVRQVPYDSYTVLDMTLTFVTPLAAGDTVEGIVTTSVSGGVVRADADRAEVAMARAEAAAGTVDNVMNADDYDPDGIRLDAFDMDNMKDGSLFGPLTLAARDWAQSISERIFMSGSLMVMRSPDSTKQLTLNNDGAWGVFDLTAGAPVGLSLNRGGTGATTHSGATANLFALSVEAAQSWTALQKRNGRKNLAAVGYEADSSLTDAMKVAARGNIGAAPALVSGQTVFTHMGAGPVVLPAGGRWSYTYVRYASGTSPNGASAGSAVGGTQIAASGWDYSVLAIKETA